MSGPSAFVQEAYDLRADDPASMAAFYDKWATAYEEEMIDKLAYHSPAKTAALLMAHVVAPNARILDVGCGTGLTAAPLHAKGYTDLTGVDLSQEMVTTAQSKGIYGRVVVGDVNAPLDLPSSHYDAIMSSGTFTHGHVDAQALPGLLRHLKVGGHLVASVHQDIWVSGGFETLLGSWVDQGVVKCVEKTLGSYYEGRENEGWFIVYQKLKEAE